MARRKPNGHDNRESMDKFAYRQEESNGAWERAVYDETTHQKLDVIASNLGANFQVKIANETISAVSAVKLDSPTNISRATNDNNISAATVFGIARTAGTAGANIEVTTAGNFYDSSLNFPVNDSIYLGANGALTNVAPVTGFLTQIGISGGPGLIIINIDEPIIL